MANFIETIRFLSDGEQVEAGVTNQPMRSLDQNVRYLKDLVDSVVRGENVIARNQVVDSAVLAGQPVYYDAASQSFKQALGNAELDEDTGSFETSATSQVWGICYEKHSAINADILVHGIGTLDLSNAIDDPINAGLYYLSNQTAGKLVSQRPPVGISVMQVAAENEDGESLFFVNTQFHDMLEAHKHYKFELLTLPAGDTSPPVYGEIHEITGADNTMEGWLPANDSIFAGKAPVGAKFGYNIGESALKNLWPPMPVEGCFMELYPGEEGYGSALPSGEGELVVFDRNGIWWMSNCYGHAPWDTGLNTNIVESASESECPLHGERRLVLWFTRPAFANNGTWVSSLTAKENSGLVLTCIDNGEAATTGHLLMDLDLSLTLGDEDTAGYVVMKGLDDNKFSLGPVVESLKSISSNVNLTSDVTAVNGKYYGNISIAVDQDLSAGELGIDVARLNGVEQEYYAGIIALGFVAGKESSYRGRFTIPTGITLPVGTQVKLVFWILNRSNLPLPQDTFTLTYRRIANPEDGLVALPLTDEELDLGTIPTSDIDPGGETNMYSSIESEPFDIAAGDQVLFEFTRPLDDFSGDLYILRQFGLYVSA